jgi:hypothetical protein
MGKKKKKENKVFDIFNKNKNKGNTSKYKSTSKKSGIVNKTTSWRSPVAKTKPIVGSDPETLSIVLYIQSTLDEIADICKPKAGGSEFQVHYRGVQYVIEKPESNKRIVFTIPTVFFNMPQKVSTASVDFNLDEVAAISKEIIPISDAIASEIGKYFPLEFFKQLGFKVSARELEMGSIHRHPGDFGFSATDLDNQVEKPGVIFRNRGCNDKIQTDSVMYLKTEGVKIVVTETRGVTVAPSEDEGIEGHYLETPTISYVLQDKVYNEGFQEFFGGEEDSSQDFKYIVDQKWITKEYPEIKEIFNAFLEEFDYEPKLLIDPELITQSYGGWSGRSYNYNRKNSYGNHGYYGDYWDDYDVLDDDDDDDNDLTGLYDKSGGMSSDVKSGTTAKERKTLTRAPWRKTQTLGKLRVAKIELGQFPDIDGSTSDKDIIAIVTAMKAAQYTDAEIRQLLADCDYPSTAMATYYNHLADAL